MCLVEPGCRDRDRELANAVAKGDDASLATFFRAYHDSLFRYMRCLVRSIDDAEDLAQDSLLTAAERIRSYRGESSLKTWVHQVAYHTFTRWSRQSKRPMIALEVLDAQTFDRLDSRQILLDALDKLPLTLAQPLILQEVVDLSVEEIARILEIPPGTVKSRLFTARQRLRQIIGEP